MEIFTDSVQPNTDGIYFCHLCEYTGKRWFFFHIHSPIKFIAPALAHMCSVVTTILANEFLNNTSKEEFQLTYWTGVVEI